jgi:hypothetical protein
MLRPQVGRLLRKALVLAVLLASVAVMNNESTVRKVAAQTSCCQVCADYINQCINSCSGAYYSQCYYACMGRYNICRSQCNPPCS